MKIKKYINLSKNFGKNRFWVVAVIEGQEKNFKKNWQKVVFSAFNLLLI